MIFNKKKTEDTITVIGGGNMDIQGIPFKTCNLKDSNPGKITYSLGGVGRNIGENLAKLDLPVRLLTAVGQDLYGQEMLQYASQQGIDINDCLVTGKATTATYMYVSDKEGDMVVAIADMDIMDQMDTHYFADKIERIERSTYTVIDTNLSKKNLETLLEQLNKTKVILDTVSGKKALRVADSLHHLYAIKLNRLEGERLLKRPLDTREAIVLAGKDLLEQGCKKVMISLGDKGLYYTDGQVSIFGEPLKVSPINTTGAGDALTSGLVYALYHKMSGEALVKFCIAAATVVVLSPTTIAEDFSVKKIQKFIDRLNQ